MNDEDNAREEATPAENIRTVPEYIRTLNEEQRRAVYHEGSPLLILAGAGSGKTRVITTKIAYLVDRKGIDPSSILAVTFTNKAAAEMHQRVQEMVPEAWRVTIRTFHSFGAWLLRRNSHLLDMQKNFSIYDDEDSLTLLHSIYDSFKRKELRGYARAISRAKDYCLTPEDDLSEFSWDSRFAEMYAAYERKLRDIGNADFGDLIKRPVELLREDPDVRKRVQSRFRVILVDEYQDSNVAQYELLKQLYGPQTYLCVVGDDDQSIYRFRGAEVKNIISFPDVFPETEVVRLERNYRSTETILEIAGEVVSHNKDRLGKTLWTDLEGGGEATLAHVRDQDEEAEYCARLLEDGNLEGTAILYRTNAQSRSFETLFLRRGIPYKIIGSLRFYEREEVKDAIALLHFLMNTKDEVSFRRIINKPSRGLGEKSVGKIVEAAQLTGGDLYKAVRQAASEFSGKSGKGVGKFVEYMEKLFSKLENAELGGFLKTAFRLSGLLEHHRKQDEVTHSQKVSNLEELSAAAAKYQRGFEGLERFLEDLELDRARIAGKDPAKEPGVTLITMHNTKGLEFDRVIITGLEEGLFPSRPDEKDDELEEERRIFYVAVTRAKRELHFTTCRRRMLWGRTLPQHPSRFLYEIPSEHLRVVDGSGNSYTGDRAGLDDGSGNSYTGDPVGSDDGSGNSYTGDLAGSDDGGAGVWERGQRIYHDEYGPGMVEKVEGTGRSTVLHLLFESGRKGTFMPAYTPIEIIAEEEI